jgi:hypothetical protein
MGGLRRQILASRFLFSLNGIAQNYYGHSFQLIRERVEYFQKKLFLGRKEYAFNFVREFRGYVFRQQYASARRGD